MLELIKVEKRENKETVNARDLHEFLEVKSRFNDWINNRISKYEFIENVDYTIVTKKIVTEANDYFISIDMAKELSMVENNEKGKLARRYFIEREKQAKALSVPTSFAEALRLAADLEEQKLRLEQENLANKPKVEFYDDLVDSKDLFPIGDVAKLINCGMGRNNLFKILRYDKILMENNVPYQKFVDAKYFEIRERSYKNRYQETKISLTTYVTQRGISYLKQKYGNREI